MVFRAKLRRLEFDTRQGKLVEAAVVKERWAAILVVIKERILAVPDKLAPELTALTEERQVRDNLKREMHAILKAIHEDTFPAGCASETARGARRLTRACASSATPQDHRCRCRRNSSAPKRKSRYASAKPARRYVGIAFTLGFFSGGD